MHKHQFNFCCHLFSSMSAQVKQQSRFLQKLTVADLVKKFRTFY
jgi:hypothetical protein